MNSKEIIKYLKNSIDEKGNYCYSLPVETTRKTIKCIKEKDNEIERLNNIINELDKFLNELKTDTENDIKYSRSKNDDEEIIRLNREFNMIDMIFVKLQELKGSDSNGN